MPRGGKRPGAGQKKGAKWPSTITKEQARERVRQRVNAALDPMLDSQIASAVGIAHLMLRDPKTGKFERVTDEAGIDAALASEGQAVWIYTKDPSVQAWTDLANRALDKPKEQEQEVSLDASVVFTWLK